MIPSDTRPVRAILLAAGQGTRMKSRRPKVLFDLSGWPLLVYPLWALARVAPVERFVIVIGKDGESSVREAVNEAGDSVPEAVRIDWALQEIPRGTGDAVRAASTRLGGFEGVVLVCGADSPFVGTEDFQRLLEPVRRGEAKAALLTATLADPASYGRVVRDRAGGRGALAKIVEASEATPEELAIREINAGAYAFDYPTLARALDRVTPTNSKAEYFLTDAIGILVSEGHRVVPILASDPEVALGVNSQRELARANVIWQERILAAHLAAGVNITDTRSTYIEQEVAIGQDTVLHPFTILRRGTRIGEGCEIGPFAHLRGGARVEDGAEVGNFVEVKNSVIGAGAKAKHLAYIGDTDVGERANIGAGTIVANYDGRAKHRTRIGSRAFIGSGTVLVAPVEIGDGALTGAGSVVLAGRNVGPGEAVVGVPSRKIGMREW